MARDQVPHPHLDRTVFYFNHSHQNQWPWVTISIC